MNTPCTHSRIEHCLQGQGCRDWNIMGYILVPCAKLRADLRAERTAMCIRPVLYYLETNK